jgi:hypothetical protein
MRDKFEDRETEIIHQLYLDHFKRKGYEPGQTAETTKVSEKPESVVKIKPPKEAPFKPTGSVEV